MSLRLCAKVLLHVWLYAFYDMTLSTAWQRRHTIINIFEHDNSLISNLLLTYVAESLQTLNNHKRCAVYPNGEYPLDAGDQYELKRAIAALHDPHSLVRSDT